MHNRSIHSYCSVLNSIILSLLVVGLLVVSSFAQGVGGKAGVGGNGGFGGGFTASAGPSRVHLTAGCLNTAATSYPLTIPSTTSGNVLAVAGYNEGNIPTVAPTSLTWAASTVTVSSTLNPGTGNTVAIWNAIPQGYNGVFTVGTSTGSAFTYSLASNPGTEIGAGNAALSPTIAISGATLIPQEADISYDSHRTMMLWTAVSNTGGATTATVTWPVSTTGCLAVGEYSGQTAVDVSANSPSGPLFGQAYGVSPFAGNTVTPTASKNEVMFGEVFDPSGPNHTSTFGGASGWTVGATAYENGGTFGSFAYYEQIVASTSGTYAVSGTQSGTGVDQDITQPATFKP